MYHTNGGARERERERERVGGEEESSFFLRRKPCSSWGRRRVWRLGLPRESLTTAAGAAAGQQASIADLVLCANLQEIYHHLHRK